jgi:hypothetical protein
MTTMKRRLSFGGSAIALGLVLAGCSGNNNTPTPTPTPTPTVGVRQEDSFGIAFGTAFRAPADSEPYSPADGDLTAVSLTAEPVTIN